MIGTRQIRQRALILQMSSLFGWQRSGVGGNGFPALQSLCPIGEDGSPRLVLQFRVVHLGSDPRSVPFVTLAAGQPAECIEVVLEDVGARDLGGLTQSSEGVVNREAPFRRLDQTLRREGHSLEDRVPTLGRGSREWFRLCHVLLHRLGSALAAPWQRRTPPDEHDQGSESL